MSGETPRKRESATVMLERVTPFLDEEFPTLDPAARERVLDDIPFHAGVMEARKLRTPEQYGPEQRLELWIDVMRDVVRQVLQGAAERN